VKIIGRSWLIHNATSVYTQVPKGYGATSSMTFPDVTPANKAKANYTESACVRCHMAHPRRSEAELRVLSLIVIKPAVCNAGVVGCTPILGPGDFFEYHRYIRHPLLPDSLFVAGISCACAGF